jgi:hypothetical protein
MQDGISEIRDLETTPRLSEFLGEMTFSGYQELGFSGVLLVEGRTDVKTIQQFLRMRKKDHQFVILSLGGSSGITEHSASELEEIRRISSNVLAVIDSERSSESTPIPEERLAFAETCRAAGIPCTILNRRATENYLAEHAIKKIKGDKYRVLGHHEPLTDVPLGWGKHENWRIAREMSLADLERTDLGGFLDNL